TNFIGFNGFSTLNLNSNRKKIIEMKNQLILIIALLVGSSVSAQLVGTSQAGAQAEEDKTATPGHPGHTGVIDDDRAVPFWTEDFAGGFPAAWVVIDSSALCPWTYTFDGSWGYWNGNSATAPNAAMNSTTAANGYLICDNDSANHFTYGQPSGTTYEYLATYFGTSAIDCSAEPAVILSFEQYFRYNNGVSMWVQVSTDSAIWTSFDVSGGIPNNTFSADPDVVTLNLSAIAGSQPTVYLRFGWSARVYFWSIDDISLSPAEPNDVAITSGFWEENGVNAFQHYKMPLSQPMTLTYRGGITNNTGGTLNDIFLDFDLDDGTGSVFTGTSALMNLTATQLDTFDVTATWTPSVVGDYTATFTADITAAIDGDLSNNVMTDDFQITSSIYGLDNLTSGLTGSSGSISNWSGNTGLPFGIGNLYEIYADAQVECVDIGITNDPAHVGEIIYGIVYVWDGAAWQYRGQTDDYTVQAGEPGTIISLPFTDVPFVSTGELMLCLGGHYGGADVSFAMAQAVPDAMVYGFDGAGAFFWLSSPRAIVVRANFYCGLGTDELENDFEVSAYPNPFENQLNISFSLATASDVSFTLVDIQGKEILGISEEIYQAGDNELTLNTSGFAAGVYTLKLLIGDIQITKKVVLER
ncbi:T9SS type A sorting domain-containing protein, partial [Crocinitomix catalasitica]|nr:T9SS type A sorting domain-containing protein [Crocinitomix catalasitica]